MASNTFHDNQTSDAVSSAYTVEAGVTHVLLQFFGLAGAKAHLLVSLDGTRYSYAFSVDSDKAVGCFVPAGAELKVEIEGSTPQTNAFVKLIG